MAVNYNPSIVRDKLVLYLDAANPKSYSGSGTTWTDISGNGNNGTISGATYSSNDGGYFDFDGSNDEVVIDNSDDNASFGIGTKPFYLEAWVYLDTEPTNGTEMYIGGQDAMVTADRGISLIYMNNGTLRLQTKFFTSTFEIPVTIPTSTWTYVAIGRRSDNTFFTNKNGVDVYTATNTADVGEGTNSFMIGNGFYSSREWDGRIAIVRYSVGRSLSEIQLKQNYNAQRWRFTI